MVSRRVVLGLGVAAAGASAAAGLTGLAYGYDMERARALVAPELSKVIPTRFGDLEYAEAGTGTPLLMVHGTGGGFDQGLFFARRFIDAGYRVIAPSRFGYLRSAFPDDPSSENQADALRRAARRARHRQHRHRWWLGGGAVGNCLRHPPPRPLRGTAAPHSGLLRAARRAGAVRCSRPDAACYDGSEVRLPVLACDQDRPGPAYPGPPRHQARPHQSRQCLGASQGSPHPELDPAR